MASADVKAQTETALEEAHQRAREGVASDEQKDVYKVTTRSLHGAFNPNLAPGWGAIAAVRELVTNCIDGAEQRHRSLPSSVQGKIEWTVLDKHALGRLGASNVQIAPWLPPMRVDALWVAEGRLHGVLLGRIAFYRDYITDDLHCITENEFTVLTIRKICNFGYSSKVGQEHYKGKFGDGFKSAIAAILRRFQRPSHCHAGKGDIEFFTKGRVWSFEFDKASDDLMRMQYASVVPTEAIPAGRKSDRFSDVDKKKTIAHAWWGQGGANWIDLDDVFVKEMFLDFCPPKEIMPLGSTGAVIYLDKSMKGYLFVQGVRVCYISLPFGFSYDRALNPHMVRDRTAIPMNRVEEAFASAVRKFLADPNTSEKDIDFIYSIIADEDAANSAAIRRMVNGNDREFTVATDESRAWAVPLANAFRREHGMDAFPYQQHSTDAADIILKELEKQPVCMTNLAMTAIIKSDEFPTLTQARNANMTSAPDVPWDASSAHIERAVRTMLGAYMQVAECTIDLQVLRRDTNDARPALAVASKKLAVEGHASFTSEITVYIPKRKTLFGTTERPPLDVWLDKIGASAEEKEALHGCNVKCVDEVTSANCGMLRAIGISETTCAKIERQRSSETSSHATQKMQTLLLNVLNAFAEVYGHRPPKLAAQLFGQRIVDIANGKYRDDSCYVFNEDCDSDNDEDEAPPAAEEEEEAPPPKPASPPAPSPEGSAAASPIVIDDDDDEQPQRKRSASDAWDNGDSGSEWQPAATKRARAAPTVLPVSSAVTSIPQSRTNADEGQSASSSASCGGHQEHRTISALAFCQALPQYGASLFAAGGELTGAEVAKFEKLARIVSPLLRTVFGWPEHVNFGVYSERSNTIAFVRARQLFFNAAHMPDEGVEEFYFATICHEVTHLIGFDVHNSAFSSVMTSKVGDYAGAFVRYMQIAN